MSIWKHHPVGWKPKKRAVSSRLEGDTWRVAEYHPDEDLLYFVGEEWHGFDYNDSVEGDAVPSAGYYAGAAPRVDRNGDGVVTTQELGTAIWRCIMNSEPSELMRFLMSHNEYAAADLQTSLVNGFESYADTFGRHKFLRLEPLASHRLAVNLRAPKPGEDLTATTDVYSTDYRHIPHQGVYYALVLDNENGNIRLGLGAWSIEKVVGYAPAWLKASLVPDKGYDEYKRKQFEAVKAGKVRRPNWGAGDGTADRDNGVRGHIAFRAKVVLAPDKKAELLRRFPVVEATYDESSVPYRYLASERKYGY